MANSPIKSYRDLDVYQRSYRAMLRVMKDLIPKLPTSEKYDLCDQLSRSSKAIPRLIAEGFAKKHQKLGFKKYLDDALAESNETAVSVEQVRDIYGIEAELCSELVEEYDIISKQLYKSSVAWDDFTRKTKNKDQ